MRLFKSKMGFTLIELLVVIGILAVLAAIAIPSVAGLIDRANVSADATNANEMTNAIERFTSEYELYCQDLASGRVKAGDLDSAQGRVFNVTGADSREDIELLESTGLNGKQINRDTKYPTNATTMQSLVENYMKTSSTTFTPKQSDCHYYYSPDCGVVVCTETAKSSTTDLNKLIQSGKDAKGNALGAETKWIDMTLGAANSGENDNASLPEKGKTLEEYTWEEVQQIVKAGKATEYNFNVGDTKTLTAGISNAEFDSNIGLTINNEIIYNQIRTATLIGLNHDGENTATFMITNVNGIGKYSISIAQSEWDYGYFSGGYEMSEIRSWLNTTIYDSLSVKNQIKEVQKKTTNGAVNTNIKTTNEKVFLLSLNEFNLGEHIAFIENDNPIFLEEGTPYEYFANGNFFSLIDDYTWTRTSSVCSNETWYGYQIADWDIEEYPYSYGTEMPSCPHYVHPAFVIG